MSSNFKSSKQIRQEFFEFFESKMHTLVPSASLVPDNDQTLLFTNAGMNQFKDVFLGTGTRPYKRAVDTQKVMRVSGKHNDFDDVGRDTYHHTFFEMLGNWSFGDFYKKEAIAWAWELLTEKWALPKERLYATVHYSDEESFELWKEVTDIAHDHILKCGDKENFWEMGAVGPCGPCTEIHIDLTPNLTESIGAKGVNADDPRFIELWNLVFMEFNRQENGDLAALPAKNVDTGMGFERIAAVLQGKTSNYNTDLFVPIIEHLAKESGVTYEEGPQGTPHRVIADHIRALTFAIGDGIIPANDGRGYVIRKILRRAIRFGRELGYTKPFLYNIVDIVVDMMGDYFTEIKERQSSIKSVIQSEEESFFRTLNKGFDKIKELISSAKSNNKNQISGADVFVLYDSMGFPVDFTEQILKDEDLSFDKEEFDKLMLEQKERARASWKGEGINFSAFGNVAKTNFIGHDCDQSEATIIGLIKDNQKTSSVEEGDEVALVLDQTPFYGQKGGQIGDSGTITSDANIIEIFDTKIFEEKFVHLGKVVRGSFKEGQKVSAAIDTVRRLEIARNHSAAHLLFEALREVLGSHIGQAGSFISENRIRIDFTHPSALTQEEMRKIESIVNEKVLANHETVIMELPIEEAKKTGAVAAFEEKYGDIVRIVTIGTSKEFCAGSHVASSGEIGAVSIIGDGSVSAGTRRFEATTGTHTLDRLNQKLSLERDLCQLFKCSDSELVGRIEKLIEDSKNKDKQLEQLRSELSINLFKDLQNKAHKIKDHEIIISELDHSDNIEYIIKHFKDHVSSGMIVLGVKKDDGGATLSSFVTKDLLEQISANELIQHIAPIVDGRGGGKPQQATAGGKNGAAIADALKAALTFIQNKIK
ncbi:MAG: alanine--tRNA ligase [Brevinema sp.]